MKGFALLCAAFVVSSLSFSPFVNTADAATSIPLNFVRPTTFLYNGMAVDSLTGVHYSRSWLPDAQVSLYITQANFENGSVAANNALAGSDSNQYFAVSNGKYFGRTSSTTSAIGRWDATTGLLETSIPSLPDTGGNNSTHTFNWGGFSGPNFFSDTTGLYVLGKSLSNAAIWHLHKLDANLNVLNTKSFSPGGIGFAFMANGQLFYGGNYNNKSLSGVFDYASGTTSPLDYVFSYTNPSNSIFIDHTVYVPSTDTLYLHDANDNGRLYKLANASSIIPEPASLSLLALGATALLRRKR
jgi:hypothetical protein